DEPSLIGHGAPRAAVRLRVTPRQASHEPAPGNAAASLVLDSEDSARRADTTVGIVSAWIPWALLTVMVFLWGCPPVKNALNRVPGAVFNWSVPFVHGVVHRMPPVVGAKSIDKAVYEIKWLSSPGTGILIAAVLSGLLVRLSLQEWALSVTRTALRLRLPLL